MKKAVEKYGDINIPNYSLVSREPKVKITFKRLKEEKTTTITIVEN